MTTPIPTARLEELVAFYTEEEDLQVVDILRELLAARETLAALIWDVENKVGDPHTLRHAKACLPQPEKQEVTK
jgi:hypothetical protein